jgi:molybdate transport system substrate-binding protein
MTNRLPIGRLVLGLTALGSAGCGHTAVPREVHVAAAANLREALDEIARGFESKTGIHVVSTIGATAQLAQQVENGAPVDVFLAADTQHVDQLISKGVADPQSRAIYARGRLVLWAPQRTDITSLRDLASPHVNQVGCAKPELAPYGAAAIQALKHEGLWQVVEPKLVYAQSISAAKQFADSGNVAAAFTALSLIHNQSGHYVLIDERLHDPLDQALCIVKQSAQPDSARQFRDYVMGDAGRSILVRYGYTQPPR